MCRRYQVPIKIDPTLFERYGITRVPAVVYAGEKDSFKIQGDAGLDYLLERINRDAKSTTLAKLINQLRGPH
jgi:predicted DsbA family dithiol-disulfide isomerase